MEHSYKTFVSIGNGKQNFTRLLNAVIENINLLPKPILIQHGHTDFKENKCDTIDFVAMDDFTRYISHAEILILHAGAGSIMQALKNNKKAIIMPRLMRYDEVVNDHQVALATILQSENKVVMVETSQELARAIQIMLDQGNFLNTQHSMPKALSIIKNRLQHILLELK